MNKATLSGNIGQIDPFEANGKTAYRFTLATTSSYKDKNGDYQKKTEWHNITAFHGLASYLKVGSRVLIEGKITTRKVEKDGVVKYYTGIVVSGFDTLEIFDTKEKSDEKPLEGVVSPEDIDDSEIPF